MKPKLVCAHNSIVEFLSSEEVGMSDKYTCEKKSAKRELMGYVSEELTLLKDIEAGNPEVFHFKLTNVQNFELSSIKEF